MASTHKVSPLDTQLSEHITQAEDHLVKAINLFTEHKQLTRSTGYFARLVRAQELVTTLRSEELVRLRGPMRKR